MNRLSVFFSAVMAGAAVAFGGTVFLALENKVIGAGLFTVGLFLVCEYGFHLFTGKVCSALRSGLRYALDLPVIWLGNFVGAWLTARIILLTRMASLSKKALALSNVKAGGQPRQPVFSGRAVQRFHFYRRGRLQQIS